MKWKKYRLETTTVAEDLVSAILAELGVEGVEIEDKIPLSEEEMAEMFINIGPTIEPDDGKAYVSFYLDSEADSVAILDVLMAELKSFEEVMDLGSLKLEESLTQDEDWINNWKVYFHSFAIDDVLITPSWEKTYDHKNYRHVIEIDPGTAFGTGKHETTNLCIRALKDYVKPGMQMLDIGIGSGILGLMALKFGAAKVIGTDLDEQALHVTKENMEKNHIPEEDYEVLIGNLIDDEQLLEYVKTKEYQIITANIIAEVLVEMMPRVKELLAPGGIYITSGILNEKEELVSTAIRANGMKILEVNHQGEWTLIVATN
ncbi:ribosomal protein L11 methyltransferase [Lachnospiraceae bacterium PFB1-21]